VSDEYVVVKHAGVNWKNKWEEDPKLTRVHHSHTAAFTFTGKSCGCEYSYKDLAAAEAMAVKLNQSNPCGDYAVCRLVPTPP
jgi:hypothetical protein